MRTPDERARRGVFVGAGKSEKSGQKPSANLTAPLQGADLALKSLSIKRKINSHALSFGIAVASWTALPNGNCQAMLADTSRSP